MTVYVPHGWNTQCFTIMTCYVLQVAGYVTEYDVNDFRFITVKGSGHMVIIVCDFHLFLDSICSDIKYSATYNIV